MLSDMKVKYPGLLHNLRVIFSKSPALSFNKFVRRGANIHKIIKIRKDID